MKIYKSILTLFIGSLLIACSSDGDGTVNELDSIIGSWTPIRNVKISNDDTEEIYLYNECERMSRFIFKENGELEISRFETLNDSSQDCASSETIFISGSWENIGEGLYETEQTNQFDGEEFIDLDTPLISFPSENLMRETYENSGNLKSEFFEYQRTE